MSQAPLSALPEFSDSRQEPYGPTPLVAGTISSPVDLDEFVRATLDGAIGDESFASQDEAAALIERALTERVRRPLNASERTKLGIAVATEWNARFLGPWHSTDGHYWAS